MKLLKPTRHAAERWQERVNGRDDVVSAWHHIRRSERFDLPQRYASVRWSRHHTVPRGHTARYVFSVRAVLVTYGARVVTLFPTSDDDVATVIVWTMMRQWLDD